MLSEKFEPSSPHILSKACNTYYYTTARIWHLSFNSSTLENDDYSETVWETFAKIISGCNFLLPLVLQWRQPSPPVSCEEVCVKWNISFPISSYFIHYYPALLSARTWNNEMQIILPHISWYDRSWQTFRERKMAIFFSCFAVFATNVSSLRIIPNLQSLSKSWWDENENGGFVVIHSSPWPEVNLDNPALLVSFLLIKWSVWIVLNVFLEVKVRNLRQTLISRQK